MNPDHQAAVHEAARRMRDWRETRLRKDPGRKPGRIYSGRDPREGTRQNEPPCAPIEALREAGEIDVRTDTHLTALAHRLSYEEIE